MLATIKSKEELFRFVSDNGMTISAQGHAIPKPDSSLATLHAEVFDVGGEVIEDYHEGMSYRTHYLPNWAVIRSLSKSEKQDMIYLIEG